MKVRKFDTGATRNDDTGALEPWGFSSALVEKTFSEYMNQHRIQGDGELRPSDNWRRGIPVDAYWHSLSRHILDFRLLYEGFGQEARTQDMIDALCGILFNTQGLIYELKKIELKAMGGKIDG